MKYFIYGLAPERSAAFARTNISLSSVVGRVHSVHSNRPPAGAAASTSCIASNVVAAADRDPSSCDSLWRNWYVGKVSPLRGGLFSEELRFFLVSGESESSGSKEDGEELHLFVVKFVCVCYSC